MVMQGEGSMRSHPYGSPDSPEQREHLPRFGPIDRLKALVAATAAAVLVLEVSATMFCGFIWAAGSLAGLDDELARFGLGFGLILSLGPAWWMAMRSYRGDLELTLHDRGHSKGDCTQGRA